MVEFDEFPRNYPTPDGHTVPVWGTEEDHSNITKQLNSPGPSPAKTLITILVQHQEKLQALERTLSTISLQASEQETLRLLEEKEEKEKQKEEGIKHQIVTQNIIRHQGIVTELLQQRAQQQIKFIKELKDISVRMHNHNADFLNSSIFSSETGKTNIHDFATRLNEASTTYLSSSKGTVARIQEIEKDINKLSTYAKTRKLPDPQPIFKGTKEEQDKLRTLYHQQEAKKQKTTPEKQAQQDSEIAYRLATAALRLRENLTHVGIEIEAEIRKDIGYIAAHPDMSPEEKNNRNNSLAQKQALSTFSRSIHAQLDKDLRDFMNNTVDNAFDALAQSSQVASIFVEQHQGIKKKALIRAVKENTAQIEALEEIIEQADIDHSTEPGKLAELQNLKEQLYQNLTEGQKTDDIHRITADSEKAQTIIDHYRQTSFSHQPNR